VIRVLIAAPSAVVRAGLQSLLAANPAMELAGSYPDLSAVEALRPDVVLAALPLADLSPPGDSSAPPIVLLGGEGSRAWTRDALLLGVRALLPADAAATEILAAVEAAASGLAVLDPHELGSLLPDAVTTLAEESPALTSREIEVLGMMAEGAANKNIAWKLGISEHTVKFYVTSIFNKLSASTRAEAVAIGFRKGLILV
jgi:DNA-binding NarL/FixJ family response regulator